MTLNTLNNTTRIDEGLIGFISKLLKSTKKFKDGTTDSEKEEYVSDKVAEIVKKVEKMVPKLRKWETQFELGDKLSKTQIKDVIDNTNTIIGRMRDTLYKTPEKALTLDNDKVITAIIGNALKQSTGQKQWTEASWLEMIASKLI